MSLSPFTHREGDNFLKIKQSQLQNQPIAFNQIHNAVTVDF